MTGSWLAQMGWDVTVAAPRDQPRAAYPRAGRPARPPAPAVPLTGRAVAGWLRAGQAAVVDLETSKRFLSGHIPGAAWALRGDLARPELADHLGRPERLVLTSSDGYLAAWAAADLRGRRAARARPRGRDGGLGAVRPPAGVRPGRMLSPALDVYRRPYEGTDIDPAVMQAYLDWEYGLVAQLERDGTHGFRVLAR